MLPSLCLRGKGKASPQEGILTPELDLKEPRGVCQRDNMKGTLQRKQKPTEKMLGFGRTGRGAGAELRESHVVPFLSSSCFQTLPLAFLSRDAQMLTAFTALIRTALSLREQRHGSAKKPPGLLCTDPAPSGRHRPTEWPCCVRRGPDTFENGKTGLRKVRLFPRVSE